MAKKGYSRKTLFGGPDSRVHYDSSGKKIGYSRPSIFGGINHYDADGRKTGHSFRGLFGVNHYDERGKRVGTSHEGLFGQTVHQDYRSGDRSDTFSYGALSSTSGDSLGGQFMHDYESLLDQDASDDSWEANTDCDDEVWEDDTDCDDEFWEDGTDCDDEVWEDDIDCDDEVWEDDTDCNDEAWSDEADPCAVDHEAPAAIPDIEITEQGMNKIKQAIIKAIQSASNELNVNVTVRFQDIDDQIPADKSSDTAESPTSPTE